MADVTQFKFGESNRTKVGTFSIDTTTATGTQAITGVGFVPQVCIFFATDSQAAGESSWGMDDGSGENCVYDSHNGTANTYTSIATISIRDLQSAANYYSGEVQSFDSDGFTITWTKNGSPTGTLIIKFIAYA